MFEKWALFSMFICIHVIDRHDEMLLWSCFVLLRNLVVMFNLVVPLDVAGFCHPSPLTCPLPVQCVVFDLPAWCVVVIL